MIVKRNYADIDVQSFVYLFSSKINNGLELSYRKETLENIENHKNFTDELKTECGIYYFIQDDTVKYIGRALPAVGLRSKISNQITAFGDAERDKVNYG